MPVYYDHQMGTFAVAPDECPDCGQPWCDTGCTAPDCLGLSCPDCDIGCDLGTTPDGGQCARAAAAETQEHLDRRIAAERAAWGLPDLQKAKGSSDRHRQEFLRARGAQHVDTLTADSWEQLKTEIKKRLRPGVRFHAERGDVWTAHLYEEPADDRS